MNSVVKGAGYILVHTPDMVIHNGTTQTTERVVNPESEYLKELPKHLRSYEDVLAYWPNQTYIGNVTPAQLAEQGSTWVDLKCPVTDRHGKYGEIMPQEEFLLLMQICDCFDVVKLDKDFVAAHKAAIVEHPLFDAEMTGRLNDGVELSEVEHLVNEEGAEGLYDHDKLVGCVKRAHDIDHNLSAHVMHENLVSKASSVLALLHGIKNAGIDKSEVEYVIDCCEEACGDMNQRGGGNFAKAAAEIAGLAHATGSDTRGFCAGPAHAIVEAASLVAAGTYKTVVVTAGGCTAKLGMNGKDHVKKDLPILEDMLGGFCVVISQNDGVNPEIDLSIPGPPHRGHRLCASGRHRRPGGRSSRPRGSEDHRHRQVLPRDAEPRHHQARRRRRRASGQLQDDRRPGRQERRPGQEGDAQVPERARPGRLGSHPGPHPLRRALHRPRPGRDARRRAEYRHDHRQGLPVPGPYDQPVRRRLLRHA